MIEDEVMTELRRIRVEFATKHDNNLELMAKAYREFTESLGLTTITRLHGGALEPTQETTGTTESPSHTS